ncbi:hypothetical protein AB0M47_06035 [Hamadaea sp. NPDC051192]|uniref:HEAT repeat domain-containing protein n=1 Tax=Hamadaea sp. NPDC051192 TaxID=3154940 RepID=UPI003448312E
MAEWAYVDNCRVAPDGSASKYAPVLEGVELGPAEARWAGLAENQATPDEILLDLVATESRLARIVLAYRWLLPPAIARRLATIAIETRDPGLVAALAEQRYLTDDEIWALMDSGFPEVLSSLAFIADPPDGLLERLAVDADSSVRYMVACRPGLGRPLVELLAADPDVEVRIALGGIVADPPSYQAEIQLRDPEWSVRVGVVTHLEPELLPVAMADSHPRVRAAVAEHPQVADELLARLAVDESPEPRWAAAFAGWRSWSLSPLSARPEWQQRLVDDPDPQVRFAIVRRLDLSDAELLTRLTVDDDPTVRGAAKARLGWHPADRPTDEWNLWDSHGAPSVDLYGKRQLTLTELEWLAGRAPYGLNGLGPTALAGASEELLRQCADSAYPVLRRLVADVKALPEDLALRLAADPDPAVHSAFELCRSTSPDVLRLVAGWPEPWVLALMANPRTPIDVLATLPGTARHIAADPATPPRTLAGLAADPDVPTRLAVAGNPSCPPDVVATMAFTESDPNVLRVVCGRSSLPVEIMRDLLAVPTTGPNGVG